MKRARLRSSGGAVFLLALLWPFAASAQASKKACIEASEQGQQLRDEGKLIKAREKFLTCVRDTCPGMIRKDCTEWLAGVDANLPSVVVSARDESGHDVTTVRVLLDGEPF